MREPWQIDQAKQIHEEVVTDHLTDAQVETLRAVAAHPEGYVSPEDAVDTVLDMTFGGPALVRLDAQDRFFLTPFGVMVFSFLFPPVVERDFPF